MHFHYETKVWIPLNHTTPPQGMTFYPHQSSFIIFTLSTMYGVFYAILMLSHNELEKSNKNKYIFKQIRFSKRFSNFFSIIYDHSVKPHYYIKY